MYPKALTVSFTYPPTTTRRDTVASALPRGTLHEMEVGDHERISHGMNACVMELPAVHDVVSGSKSRGEREVGEGGWLLLYEDYVWVSLGNAMKAKQSKTVPRALHSVHRAPNPLIAVTTA
jgi:hypothetical protein